MSTRCFQRTPDVDDVLRCVRDAGGAYAPGLLDEAFRRRLVAEVAGGSFERLDEQVGPYGVRQQAEHFVIGGEIGGEELAAFPAVAQLREALLSVLAGRSEGVEQWRPNEAAVQRYDTGSTGISPHRDGKRHRYLVAVFTLDGTAPFALCTDRDGTVAQQWTTEPGSLVLLRAPGFAGAEDGRPFHTVGGPTGRPRTSLTFRHDSRASG